MNRFFHLIRISTVLLVRSNWNILPILGLLIVAIFFNIFIYISNDPVSLYISLFILVIWDLFTLRFQDNLDIQHFQIFPTSIINKIFDLFLLQLISVRSCIIFCFIANAIFSIEKINIVPYLVAFLSYNMLSVTTLQVARRSKYASILIKQLLAIPVFIFVFGTNSKVKVYMTFFNLENLKSLLLFGSPILAILSIILLIRYIRKHPFRDTIVIKKYNKSYWF